MKIEIFREYWRSQKWTETFKWKLSDYNQVIEKWNELIESSQKEIFIYKFGKKT